MPVSARRPAVLAAGGLAVAALAAGAAILLTGGGEPERAVPSPPAPAPISGTTYYVSPRGSDEADGSRPDRAWATVSRVNRARLEPGDGVRFEGGATFGDDDLEVRASGRPGAPIVYGAYGRGRARMTRSVLLRGAGFVVVQDLELSGAPHGVASLASSRSGSPGVVVQRNRISDVGIAVNSAHPGDAGWTVRGNRIERTRDSAVIATGARARIEGNSIDGAGLDTGIEYGKHGVYLKGARGAVLDNRIRDFPDGSAVSARRRDSRVEGNDLAGGPIGISWFQEDGEAGTSRWRDNRIAGTTGACIYVSPRDAAGPTRESFVIAGNRLEPAAGRHLDLAPTTGRYAVAGNERR